MKTKLEYFCKFIIERLAQSTDRVIVSYYYNHCYLQGKGLDKKF